MSISIEGLDSATDLSENQHYVQYLPAKVSHEGSANVEGFFNKFTNYKEGQQTVPLTNAFRGRPLDGRVLELPKGYSMWVLQGGRRNQANISGEEKEIKLKAESKVNRVTVWNYDKDDLDNPISRALHWTEICDAIAVSDDEVGEKENFENGGEKK